MRFVYALVAAALLAAPAPAIAQIGPDRVAQIAKTIHDAERWDLGSRSTRDTRNKFWARVIGVVHHGHPVYNPTADPRWCLKDGGGGRPQTDDVATLCATREFWDCIGGVGADGYERNFRCNGHGGERLPPEQNVYPPPVPEGGGVTTPPPTSAIWTAAHQALRDRLGPGATTQSVAEQLAYSFPAEGWGQKRAEPGRPISADVIARRDGSRLWGVRVVPATLGAPFDITGQDFAAVAAVDHVGAGAPPPPPPPPPPPGPSPTPTPSPGPGEETLEALRAALAALTTELAALREDVARQRQEVIDAVRGQEYDIRASSRVFGVIAGTITPKPRPQ